jgi:hypothetical protein
MLRHVIVASFAVAAVVAFAPGCSPEQLNLDDYDTTCMDASDCVGVYVGDCSSCMCENAAINQEDLAKYQGDVTALGCSMGQNCDCPAAKVTCTAGKCGIGK